MSDANNTQTGGISTAFGFVPFFNTGPERIIQEWLTQNGIKFETHRKDLPGTPDIVIEPLRLIIFVHGCFWHRHHCPKGAGVPKRRRTAWQASFDKQILRDRRVQHLLRSSGWRVAVVWECEIRNQFDRVGARLADLLTHEYTQTRSGSSIDNNDRGVSLGGSKIGYQRGLTHMRGPAADSVPRAYWVVYVALFCLVIFSGLLIAAHKASLDRAASGASAAAESASLAQEQLRAIRQQIADADAQRGVAEANLQPLLAQVSQLTSTLETMRAERGRLGEEMSAAEARTQLARDDEDAGRRRIDSLKVSLASLQADMDQANRARDQALSSAQAARLALEQISRDREAASADLSKLRSELSGLDTNRRHVAEAVRTLRDEEAGVRTRLAEAQKTIADADSLATKIESLKAQVNASEQRIRETDSTVADRRNALRALDDQLARTQEQFQTLSQRVETRRQEVAELERQREAARAGIASTTAILERQQATQESLQRVQEELRVAREDLELTRTLAVQYRSQAARKQELDAEVERLGTRVSQLQAQRAELASQIQESQATIGQSGSARAEIARLTGERDALQVSIQSMTSVRDKLIKETSDAQARRSSVTLEADLQALTTSMQRLIEQVTSVMLRAGESRNEPSKEGAPQ